MNDHVWPVHRFVLLSRCANFASLLSNCVQGGGDSPDIPILSICDIPPQIMEQLLAYIYTDTCELLSPGATFHLSDMPASNANEDCIFEMELDESDNKFVMESGKKVSAFEVHQKSKGKKASSNSGDNNKSTKKGGKSGGKSSPGRDPIRMLQDVARQWGVKGLTRRSVSWFVKSMRGIRFVRLISLHHIGVPVAQW